MSTSYLHTEKTSLSAAETQHVLEQLGYRAQIESGQIRVTPDGSVALQQDGREKQFGSLRTRTELTELLKLLGQPQEKIALQPAPLSPPSNPENAVLSQRVAAALFALGKFAQCKDGTDHGAAIPPLVRLQIEKTAAILDEHNDARANLLDLVASNPFATLSERHQMAVLKTLSLQPEASAELVQLVQTPEFVRADPQTIDSALRAFARWNRESGRVARQTMSRLMAARGFHRLDGREQRLCLASLVNGALPTDEPLATLLKSSGLGHSSSILVAYLGDGLHHLVRDRSFKDGGPDLQVSMLRAILAEPDTKQGLVPSFVDRHALQHTISKPVRVESSGFTQLKVQSALFYAINIGKDTLEVYVAEGQQHELGHFPAVEDIAKCLAALPELIRSNLSPVYVEPGLNPNDVAAGAGMSAVLNRSYMICHSPGVSIFPHPDEQPLSRLGHTLAHEGGHTLWEELLNTGGFPEIYDAEDPCAVADLWDIAMAIDELSPSRYAATRQSSQGKDSLFDISDQEDLAETVALYLQVKGQPLEEEVRKVLPERFRILDAVLSGAVI